MLVFAVKVQLAHDQVREEYSHQKRETLYKLFQKLFTPIVLNVRNCKKGVNKHTVPVSRTLFSHLGFSIF